MWLKRTKSKVQIHHHNNTTLQQPHKFTCKSFKDIQSLLSDDDESIPSTSPHSPSNVYHRRSLLRTLSLKPIPDPPEIRIPGADQTVVIYFTSLRVIRSTFEDCKSVISILRAFRVSIDERDLSMDSRFMDELNRILVKYDKSKMSLPRVFIGGKYVGGAEEVRRMHENGELKECLEGIKKDNGTCETCGGFRFLLCLECNGSHKCFNDDKGGFRTCVECNENGLIRCPSCLFAIL